MATPSPTLPDSASLIRARTLLEQLRRTRMSRGGRVGEALRSRTWAQGVLGSIVGLKPARVKGDASRAAQGPQVYAFTPPSPRNAKPSLG